MKYRKYRHTWMNSSTFNKIGFGIQNYVLKTIVKMDSDDSLVDDELQPQALAVRIDDNDDFDLNIPPTTGNEYLRRVR